MECFFTFVMRQWNWIQFCWVLLYLFAWVAKTSGIFLLSNAREFELQIVTGGIIEGKLLEDFMRNAQALLFLEHLFRHIQRLDFPPFINKRYGCSSFVNISTLGYETRRAPCISLLTRPLIYGIRIYSYWCSCNGKIVAMVMTHDPYPKEGTYFMMLTMNLSLLYHVLFI